MTLSPPVARKQISTRCIVCIGYKRDDGAWDIEGRLTDTRSFAFESYYVGTVKPGMPVHDMWMRLTIDEAFTVRGIEVRMDAHPHGMCPEILPNFQRVVGLNLGQDFLRQARKLLGGVQGCTHLVELLGPMATEAFQTIRPYRQFVEPLDAPEARPTFLNGCHALATNSEVIRTQYPQYYEPK